MIKILAVDDSNFFRQRILKLFEGDRDLKLVAFAENGLEAVEAVERHSPDIVLMDYEMPMMDGITATQKILSKRSVPIIMFSSLTYEGARVTLDALNAGAVDFIPKIIDDINRRPEYVLQLLRSKILALCSPEKNVASAPSEKKVLVERIVEKPVKLPAKERSKGHQARATAPVSLPQKNGAPDLIVIGASTGGPRAIEQLIRSIDFELPCALVIVQHMPEMFTSAFAERLNDIGTLDVSLASDGSKLRAGSCLVAKGGAQLVFQQEVNGICVRLKQVSDQVQFHPSVDISFASAARLKGKSVLGIVLTGMGRDGKEGAKKLRSAGHSIWTQDQETSVVYGMPREVMEAGYSNRSLAIDHLPSAVKHLFH